MGLLEKRSKLQASTRTNTVKEHKLEHVSDFTGHLTCVPCLLTCLPLAGRTGSSIAATDTACAANDLQETIVFRYKDTT